MHNDLPAVRWVGGVEIELLAIATGARIIPRFEEISSEKLGKAGSIREMNFGTSNDKCLLVQDCEHSKAVTILIRGGSRTICDEAKRCLFDAICVVRNMIKNNKIVGGGGATELACSIAVAEKADKIEGIEQYAVRAFADALEQIPMTLAENSGSTQLNTFKRLRKCKLKTETHSLVLMPWVSEQITCTNKVYLKVLCLRNNNFNLPPK